MTVVLEDQVKTITVAIAEQFGTAKVETPFDTEIEDLYGPYVATFDPLVSVEDVVRAVIAMYDISDIGRPVDPVYLSAAIDSMVLAQAVIDHLKPVEDNL